MAKSSVWRAGSAEGRDAHGGVDGVGLAEDAWDANYSAKWAMRAVLLSGARRARGKRRGGRRGQTGGCVLVAGFPGAR